jgi:hypothetical protein
MEQYAGLNFRQSLSSDLHLRQIYRARSQRTREYFHILLSSKERFCGKVMGSGAAGLRVK